MVLVFVHILGTKMTWCESLDVMCAVRSLGLEQVTELMDLEQEMSVLVLSCRGLGLWSTNAFALGLQHIVAGQKS